MKKIQVASSSTTSKHTNSRAVNVSIYCRVSCNRWIPVCKL